MIETLSPVRAALLGRQQAGILYRDPAARRVGPMHLVMDVMRSPFWKQQEQAVGNIYGFAFVNEWRRLERPVVE